MPLANFLTSDDTPQADGWGPAPARAGERSSDDEVAGVAAEVRISRATAVPPLAGPRGRRAPALRVCPERLPLALRSRSRRLVNKQRNGVERADKASKFTAVNASSLCPLTRRTQRASMSGVYGGWRTALHLSAEMLDFDAEKAVRG